MFFDYPKNIRFECERCSICCRNTENKERKILLLREEANYISKETFIDLDEFVYGYEGSEPYVYLMKKKYNGTCFFLKDKLCSIYDIRPLVCRFYPFQLKTLKENIYVFTYTNECPSIGKGSPLKKRFFKELFNILKSSMKKNKNNLNISIYT